MALKLTPNPSFRFPVVVRAPGATTGERIQLTARHLGKAELEAFSLRATATGADDAASLLEVITDWSGIEDEQGRAVPFSALEFAAFIGNYPGVAKLIYLEYIKELIEARLKN
ncbi:MAG: phage tail assembly chaperone [Burkholderiaceae bacterium]